MNRNDIYFIITVALTLYLAIFVTKNYDALYKEESIIITPHNYETDAATSKNNTLEHNPRIKEKAFKKLTNKMKELEEDLKRHQRNAEKIEELRRKMNSLDKQYESLE